MARPSRVGSHLLEEAAAGLDARSRRSASLFVSYALTVFVVISVNFFLPRVLPGNPIDALGDPTRPMYVQDNVTRAALLHYYGLDRPLLAQYGSYLADLARADLGTSIRYHAPVVEVVAARLPWTLLLMGTAMLLALTVGLASGVHSGWRRGRAADRGMLAVFVGLYNVPAFVLASLALLVFSVELGWFPLAGARTPFSAFTGLRELADVAHHLVLPAAVLAVGLASGFFLLMRAGMISELGSDHLLLGRVKGLRERRLKYRYAARNALLPVAAAVGLELGFAVTGAIFVERQTRFPSARAPLPRRRRAVPLRPGRRQPPARRRRLPPGPLPQVSARVSTAARCVSPC